MRVADEVEAIEWSNRSVAKGRSTITRRFPSRSIVAVPIHKWSLAKREPVVRSRALIVTTFFGALLQPWASKALEGDHFISGRRPWDGVRRGE